MGHCRRRNSRARDAGQILLGVSYRRLRFRCDLSSTTSRLFRFVSPLDFHRRRVCRTRTAFALASEDWRDALDLCTLTTYRQGPCPLADRGAFLHFGRCARPCATNSDMGYDSGKPPQKAIAGFSGNEPRPVTAFSRQRRDDRPSNSHLRRTWKRYATDLGTTRSLPVRHSDCLRSELSDRTLLFGQPGRPCRWHCRASRRRGRPHSRPISKYPSIKRGAQFLSPVCDGVDTSMAPAI